MILLLTPQHTGTSTVRFLLERHPNLGYVLTTPLPMRDGDSFFLHKLQLSAGIYSTADFKRLVQDACLFHWDRMYVESNLVFDHYDLPQRPPKKILDCELIYHDHCNFTTEKLVKLFPARRRICTVRHPYLSVLSHLRQKKKYQQNQSILAMLSGAAALWQDHRFYFVRIDPWEIAGLDGLFDYLDLPTTRELDDLIDHPPRIRPTNEENLSEDAELWLEDARTMFVENREYHPKLAKYVHWIESTGALSAYEDICVGPNVAR